jgi:hypothetical protein
LKRHFNRRTACGTSSRDGRCWARYIPDLADGFRVQVNIWIEQQHGRALIPWAVLAGFKQEFVYDQLERLVAVFVPSAAKAEGSRSK